MKQWSICPAINNHCLDLQKKINITFYLNQILIIGLFNNKDFNLLQISINSIIPKKDPTKTMKPQKNISIQQKLYLIVDKVSKLNCSSILIKPLYPQQLEKDYVNKIDKQINFEIIKQKIKHGKYQYVIQIYNDLKLIAKNYFIYHQNLIYHQDINKIFVKFINSINIAWKIIQNQLQLHHINEHYILKGSIQQVDFICSIQSKINNNISNYISTNAEDAQVNQQTKQNGQVFPQQTYQQNQTKQIYQNINNKFHNKQDKDNKKNETNLYKTNHISQHLSTLQHPTMVKKNKKKQIKKQLHSCLKQSVEKSSHHGLSEQQQYHKENDQSQTCPILQGNNKSLFIKQNVTNNYQQQERNNLLNDQRQFKQTIKTTKYCNIQSTQENGQRQKSKKNVENETKSSLRAIKKQKDIQTVVSSKSKYPNPQKQQQNTNQQKDYNDKSKQYLSSLEQQVTNLMKHKLRKYKTVLKNYLIQIKFNIFQKLIRQQSNQKCYQQHQQQPTSHQHNQWKNVNKWSQEGSSCINNDQQMKNDRQCFGIQSQKYLNNLFNEQLQNINEGTINIKKLIKLLKYIKIWIKQIGRYKLKQKIIQQFIRKESIIVKSLQKIIEYSELSPQFCSMLIKIQKQLNYDKYNGRITRSIYKNNHDKLNLYINNRYSLSQIIQDQKKDKQSSICQFVELVRKCQKQIDKIINVKKYSSYKINGKLKQVFNQHQEFIKLLENDKQEKKQCIIDNKQRRKNKIDYKQYYFQEYEQQKLYNEQKLHEDEDYIQNQKKLKKNVQQNLSQIFQQQYKKKCQKQLYNDQLFLFQYSLRSNTMIIDKYQKQIQKLMINWNDVFFQKIGGIPQIINLYQK